MARKLSNPSKKHLAMRMKKFSIKSTALGHFPLTKLKAVEEMLDDPRTAILHLRDEEIGTFALKIIRQNKHGPSS